jgi:FlaA1/EpsC-like NDP-sugar epimerase
MPTVNIGDLARVMIRLIAPRFGRRAEDVEVRAIGPRPGEKQWEELNTDEEVSHTLDVGRYFVVTPALRNLYSAPSYTYPGLSADPVKTPYRSDREPPLNLAELEKFLLQPDVLTPEVRARLDLE